MAIIKLKRGNEITLTSLTLNAGEPAFVLDTGKLYIGNGTDKVLINPDITNVASSNKLATARTISLTGDITGSVSFDGSSNVSISTAYKNSGVTAGTYPKVTVDAKGNITSGTTLSASDIPNLDAAKITTGTLGIATIPTGTTSTTVSLGNHTHSDATTSVSGLMSGADKTKLNGIATGANNYSHPTGDGNLHVPATSTTNNGKVLKAGATAGSLVWGTDNDTITTINGKSGAITKDDLVALGLPAQDTVYTHPANHPASIITQDASNRFVTDTEKSTWNAKQAAITGGATTIATSNLTASRALVSDGSGKVAVSSVTSTQLGYLSGVTSAIQTQINSKLNSADSVYIGATEPTNKPAGLWWFKSDTSELQFRTSDAWVKSGGVDIVSSATEPTTNLQNGLMWYNTTKGELNIYIAGVGFKSLGATNIVQVESTYTAATDGISTIPINIDGFLDGQVLLVDHDGVLMSKGAQYTISADSKNINLIGYTINTGESIHFTNLRIVLTSEAQSFLNQPVRTTSTVEFDKIGIATATPYEKLDISGNARIRSNNSLKFGGTGASDNPFEIKYNPVTNSLDFKYIL